MAFKNQFEVIYSNFSDELEKEVEVAKFEVLDSIYLYFDSYEPNELIRENDPYCIDEDEFMEKIAAATKQLV